MSTDNNSPQVFESLIPPEVTVVHHYATKLHSWAGDICCALASASLGRQEGLKGLSTAHVGAGFGADMRTAYFWGVHDALGIESASDQITMAHFLNKASYKEIRRKICDNPITSRLYSRYLLSKVINEIWHRTSTSISNT